MVQGKINRGRYTDHLAGRYYIRTNQCPPPPSSPYFLQAGCPSCCPTNSVKALKATQTNINEQKTQSGNYRLEQLQLAVQCCFAVLQLTQLWLECLNINWVLCFIQLQLLTTNMNNLHYHGVTRGRIYHQTTQPSVTTTHLWLSSNTHSLW